MSEERLDQAIDEVARALTRGEPDEAFRARVIARIDRGAAPRATWSAAWLLAPIAVAALIVVSVFVARQDRTLKEGAPQVTGTPLTTTVAPLQSAAAALHNLLDPLVAPPLDVASIAVDALTSEPIQIERLDAISPIVVAPLDITDIQRRYE